MIATKENRYDVAISGVRFPIKGLNYYDVFKKLMDYNSGDHGWDCRMKEDKVFHAKNTVTNVEITITRSKL